MIRHYGSPPTIGGPNDPFNDGAPIYDQSLDPNVPHSLGVRDNTRPGDIARQLIDNSIYGARTAGGSRFDPSRPLIDIVQEAALDPKINYGLGNIEDPRAFRETLRKAKCFTLDAETSAMIGDLSIAVAKDLEAARQMALPPFPVTWFEFDNVARINRLRSRGIKITDAAAGLTEAGPPVDRAGWLITQDNALGGNNYCLTYFTDVTDGVLMSPLSFMWDISPPLDDLETELLQKITGRKREDYHVSCKLAFGMHHTAVNIDSGSYAVGRAPFQRNRFQLYDDDVSYMGELAGELRHAFGLLVAISAGGTGLTMSSSPRARPEGPYPVQPNGKPLLPIEHHHLHLHLGKRKTLDRVIAEAISHHRKREHDVRAHMRRLKSGRMVPVKSHKRGDKALGVVTKDYLVEK